MIVKSDDVDETLKKDERRDRRQIKRCIKDQVHGKA